MGGAPKTINKQESPWASQVHTCINRSKEQGHFQVEFPPGLENGRLREEECERLVKTPQIPKRNPDQTPSIQAGAVDSPSHLISCACVSWASAIPPLSHQNPLAKLPGPALDWALRHRTPHLAPARVGGHE